MVRKSGHICQKLVDESICRKLLAESAQMRCAYVTQRSDHIHSGGSETDRPRSF